LSRIEQGYWNGGAPPYGYDLRYESLREDGGSFLFVLRFQPDGSKLLLDETGATVRNLARGERLQVSKRDRSRLAPSAPERVETVRRIFTMSAEDGMGLRAIANSLNVDGGRRAWTWASRSARTRSSSVPSRPSGPWVPTSWASR